MEADMSETVIEFKDVDMSFGDKTVLDHVSFSVEKGETVAIIGPSGTGKSTTLKLLIGLLEPMGGSVRIKGREVNHFTEKQCGSPAVKSPQNLPASVPA